MNDSHPSNQQYFTQWNGKFVQKKKKKKRIGIKNSQNAPLPHLNAINSLSLSSSTHTHTHTHAFVIQKSNERRQKLPIIRINSNALDLNITYLFRLRPFCHYVRNNVYMLHPSYAVYCGLLYIVIPFCVVDILFDVYFFAQKKKMCIGAPYNVRAYWDRSNVSASQIYLEIFRIQSSGLCFFACSNYIHCVVSVLCAFFFERTYRNKRAKI